MGDTPKATLGAAPWQGNPGPRAVTGTVHAGYFRRGKSAHDARDAVAVGVSTRQGNGVLDADISKLFDAIEHDWPIKFMEHRVAPHVRFCEGGVG